MALDATIRARVDSNIKKEAEAIFAKIGLNTSQAINIFLNRVIQEKGIPFELKIPNEETLEAIRELENGEGEVVTLEELEKEAKECIK